MDRLITQYQARPILLYIYVVSAFPHYLEVPLWATGISVFLAIYSFFSIRQIVRPFTPLLLGAATLGTAAMIYFQFKTFLTPDAATPLLVLLAGFKLQEIRKLRDAISLLFICTLTVMAYLLYSQTLLATLYMFAAVLGIMLTFMVIHSPPNKIKEILRSSPRLVAKDTFLALPIFLAFFFLFPRFSTGWGRFTNEPQTKTGFNNSFEPGEFAKLAKSNEPAFRATFLTKAHPLMKDLYWRGLVFDKTNGWSWSRHQRRWKVDFEESTAKKFDYEVMLEPKYERNVFVLEKTEGLEWLQDEQRNPLIKEEDGIFTSTWPSLARVQYHGWTTESLPPEELNKREIEFYTQLPAHFSKRAQELSQKLTSGKANLSEKILAVLEYYTQKDFQYSFTAPETKDLDAFLFNTRVGFCEHFASSFALMMRSVGVPARVVTGFHGGEINTYGNYFLIRDSNAHAWVELYDSQLKIWRRVDPTTAVAGNRINLGGTDDPASQNYLASAFYSSQMLWDSLNNRYTQLLMNYDFGQQKDLLSLGEDVSFKRYQIFLILVFAVTFIVFLMSLSLKQTSKVARSRAQVLFEQLLKRLRRFGIHRGSTEGPWEFAERAASQIPDHASTVLNLMSQYIRWEYQSIAPSKEESKLFSRATQSIKR